MSNQYLFGYWVNRLGFFSRQEGKLCYALWQCEQSLICKQLFPNYFIYGGLHQPISPFSFSCFMQIKRYNKRKLVLAWLLHSSRRLTWLGVLDARKPRTACLVSPQFHVSKTELWWKGWKCTEKSDHLQSIVLSPKKFPFLLLECAKEAYFQDLPLQNG